MTQEMPVTFECGSDTLFGVIHLPDSPQRRSMLIVVGGPQYRAGSHRQFLLLARMLAEHGVPVMRFDHRGMGDSEGEQHSFENIDDDIRCAIDAFFQYDPDMDEIIIWGLCDAASAASFYAYQDDRVKGLVLLNPWVYTEEGKAKTYLKKYYLRRILSRGFWQKIFLLKLNYSETIASICEMLKKAYKSNSSGDGNKDNSISQIEHDLSLPRQVYACLHRFKHPILVILSGNDLTADEFRDVVNTCPSWQSLFSENRVKRHDLPAADHTFSTNEWRNQVAEWTLEWVKS